MGLSCNYQLFSGFAIFLPLSLKLVHELVGHLVWPALHGQSISVGVLYPWPVYRNKLEVLQEQRPPGESSDMVLHDSSPEEPDDLFAIGRICLPGTPQSVLLLPPLPNILTLWRNSGILLS